MTSFQNENHDQPKYTTFKEKKKKPAPLVEEENKKKGKSISELYVDYEKIIRDEPLKHDS